MAETSGWTSPPDHRGTLDILWTCFATMPLCVWTAVHPDIPLIYNFWSSFAERLRLMLLAIMFPEFILTGAWDERRQALSLFNDVQASIGGLASTTKPHPHTPPPSMNERANDDDVLTLLPYSSNTSAPGCRAESGKAQPPWSFEHAIFAVMGGFATETHYIDENNQQRTIRRIVTPEGISILARIGRLPIIDGQEIEERSKADVFAKAAVVGQCLWFACQVIGRLSQDLPVTPLETHTLIHVGCAILIYVVWMRKPYNLSQCVVVRAADIECIGSLFNFHDISRKVLIDELENYEKDRIRYWKQRIVDSSRGVSSQSLPPARPMLKSITELLDEHQIPAPQCTDEKVNILRAIAADASKGLQILRSQGFQDLQSITPGGVSFVRESSLTFTIKSVWGSWSTDDGHDLNAVKIVHALFNMLYGGLHLLAWSSFFPITAESWLWRGSALFLVAAPVWGTLWILWWMAVRSRHRALYLIRNGDLDIVAAPLFFTILLVYTWARCYFLVEALIGLRLLPAKAYSAVKWTSFLPHVS